MTWSGLKGARALSAVLSVAFAACSAPRPGDAPFRPGASLYDPHGLPPGPLGESIRYGHELMMNTALLMPKNVGAQMSCSACHVNAGATPGAGSLIGAYARFPQWNRRAHRVIALQDRIAECFLYSMNGRPPAYWSRNMVAIVSYVAWLSRGVPTLASTPAPKVPVDVSRADAVRGAAIYVQKCSECHGADGAGTPGIVPPLWGATSFNDRAGMSRIPLMARFVEQYMPWNKPGSLSPKEAVDVSAFVLAHKRPSFEAEREIEAASAPAKSF